MTAQIAVWDEAGDGRAVFLDCYARMTTAVDDALVAGEFGDGPWVAELLDRFAGYYFSTLDDERAGPVPEPWVVAHTAALGRRSTVLQLLLAGVNAHINYDLVLTLVDLLDDEWMDLDEDGRERRRADYDHINRVISTTADGVQDFVVERRAPGLDLFDKILGPLDERIAVKVLTGWRTRVWSQAIATMAEREPDRRGVRVGTLERQCARRGRWILL